MEISALPLFQGVSAQQLPRLLTEAAAQEIHFEKKEVLLRRGDTSSRLGLVLSGSVQIVREDFWGRSDIVGFAGTGEIFAESYALAGAPMEVSVIAACPGSALLLDVRCLQESHVMANLLTLLAQKNLMLTGKMRHMACRSTRDKLLSYLSAQAMAAGSPEFNIPMDRQQLADYLAVDRSAMSAALSKLQAEETLTFRKNHFHLLSQQEEVL